MRELTILDAAGVPFDQVVSVESTGTSITMLWGPRDGSHNQDYARSLEHVIGMAASLGGTLTRASVESSNAINLYPAQVDRFIPQRYETYPVSLSSVDLHDLRKDLTNNQAIITSGGQRTRGGAWSRAEFVFAFPTISTCAEFLQRCTQPTNTDDIFTPSDEATSGMPEGMLRTQLVNRYERSENNRKKCIAHHGTRCVVCDLDFQERYGAIGSGYIHVHHLTPVSTMVEGTPVDPVRDLVPVCPNCHAMLHMRSPDPYTPDDLREMLS